MMNQHQITTCAACLLWLAIAGCGQQPPAHAPPTAPASPVAASAPAAGTPGVSLKTLDCAGLERLIAGKRGKVVVLDAWSTACPPCIKNFPDLVALHRQIGAERLACISLSLDYEGIGKPDDVAPAVLAFLRKQGATFDNVLASDEPEAIYKKLEIASIPAVFVYDARGKLRQKFTDGAGGKESPVYRRVEALVKKLLAEK